MPVSVSEVLELLQKHSNAQINAGNTGMSNKGIGRPIITFFANYVLTIYQFRHLHVSCLEDVNFTIKIQIYG